MYSAYDGVHVFRVPATAYGVKVERWSAEPAAAVDIEQDASGGNALLTMRRAGTFQIVAPILRSCGVRTGDACAARPVPHRTCPSVDINVVLLTGCCIERRCGLLGRALDGECRDLESLRADSQSQSFASSLPAPQACD